MAKGISVKENQVKSLAEDIEKARTLMLVSIRGLPSKQFQEIKKSIRDYVKIKVAKKNIMLRAIKESGKETLKSLENHIERDCAFLVSDMEGYELAGILVKKKSPVFAKAGQVADGEIEVKGGPTDLVPGPAISELGSLGIQVAVEDGKIAIKQDKIIINKGQTINENAASILQKLNIQPFSVGLKPLVIYDVKEEKLYTDIDIDTEKYTGELKTSAGKALGFAQKIMYYCRETIGYFLGKANAEASALESKQESADKKEGKDEEGKEEAKKEQSQNIEEDNGGKKETEEKKEENKESKDETQLNKPEEKA